MTPLGYPSGTTVRPGLCLKNSPKKTAGTGLFQSKKLPAPLTRIQGKVFRTSQFEKFAAGENPHPRKGFKPFTALFSSSCGSAVLDHLGGLSVRLVIAKGRLLCGHVTGLPARPDVCSFLHRFPVGALPRRLPICRSLGNVLPFRSREKPPGCRASPVNEPPLTDPMENLPPHEKTYRPKHR
jgi:hypothetical protein